MLVNLLPIAPSANCHILFLLPLPQRPNASVTAPTPPSPPSIQPTSAIFAPRAPTTVLPVYTSSAIVLLAPLLIYLAITPAPLRAPLDNSTTPISVSTAIRSAAAVIPLIQLSATLVQEGTTFQVRVVLVLALIQLIQIFRLYIAVPVRFSAKPVKIARIAHLAFQLISSIEIIAMPTVPP